jgi:hypothetical protein
MKPNMSLEQPSDTFTDQVMDAVTAQQKQLDRKPSVISSTSVPIAIGKHQKLMNAMLATAATFFFIVTGVYSNVIGLQGGEFSLAVRETVSHTIYTGIELLSEAIYRL